EPTTAVVSDSSETPTIAVQVEPIRSERSSPEAVFAQSAEEALTESEEVNEQRVEVLKTQLLSSPGAAAQVVDELVTRLHALGRDEEAYALLRAQFDDATGSERTRIAQALRRVLTSLIETANQQSRP